MTSKQNIVRIMLAVFVIWLSMQACNLPLSHTTTAANPVVVNPTSTPMSPHQFHSVASHRADVDPVNSGDQPGWIVSFWNDTAIPVESLDVVKLSGEVVQTLHPGEMQVAILDKNAFDFDGLYLSLPDGRKCIRFETNGLQRLYTCQNWGQ
jgi:hypothetical protein